MKQEYIEKIYSGWLAKIIGIRYGAPIEGWSYEKIRNLFGDRLPDYPAAYKNFAADDDSNGPWFFLRALEDSGEATPQAVAQALLNYAPYEHGFFWWGGYGVSTEHTAYLNLRNGIPAPQSGSMAQNGSTMAEQIGGQIFSDTWGLVNPGHPERAARMARAAASVTHDGDGLNGAAFVAASISAAFEERDIRKVMETGISFVEPGSRYEEAVRVVMAFYDSHEKEGEAWRECFQFVKAHYGYDKYPGVCHIIPNAAVMALAMLYGGGDFDRTLEICNLCGWDTDCNVGNVACILGVALGLSTIGRKWRQPVGDLLISSSVLGYYNIQDIPGSAAYIARLAYALDGEEIPEGWREALSGERRFHFEFPGSTHAMRLRAESGNGPGDAGNGRHFYLENTEETAASGSRSLKFVAAPMEPGEVLYLYHQTYYRPEDFTDSRYDPAFSPILYPGQVVEGWVYLPEYGRPAQVSLYGKDIRNGKIYEGERISLGLGEWKRLRFQIPGGTDALLGEAGFCFRMEGRALERFAFVGMVDDLSFSGQADYRLDCGREQTEVWPGGHTEISQFTRLKGNAWLEQGRLHLSCADFGELYTGGCDWRDYRAEYVFTPICGNFHGVNLRVQGGTRSCGAALLEGGRFGLVRSRPDGSGYDLLAETAFPWKWGRPVTVTVEAAGNALRAWARRGETGEGEETAELVSPHGAGPYSNGCVGVSVRQGSHLALDGIRVWPAENGIKTPKHHQSSQNAAPNPENIHKTTEI